MSRQIPKPYSTVLPLTARLPLRTMGITGAVAEPTLEEGLQSPSTMIEAVEEAGPSELQSVSFLRQPWPPIGPTVGIILFIEQIPDQIGREGSIVVLDIRLLVPFWLMLAEQPPS